MKPREMDLFEPLLRALGVRESFEPADFVRTLASLKERTATAATVLAST